MDTLIHADIFFFVTTIAVVVVGATFTVALIYLIKILSDIKEISGHVREETVLFREDIAGLRSDIRREGFRIEHLWGFVKNIFSKKRSRSVKSNSK